ncbi:Uncharacterised protein [BD1-7 clade bacterium]|uniref:Outer membrane protein beta-barrel domain-containing protein n=1 Tax=BD1-7 clade bacterium TaxID=2029982 RepID=A0A5S9N6E1_9GAMM|nr:Uncharacterised protein [BD1-7 clade bacterium]CAA0085421.1 Uncharacterised protein [BD1-7 clade bacterium]
MKKLLSAATVAGAFLIAPQASAEIAGFEFEVGGYAWQNELTGEISGAGLSINLGNNGIDVGSNTNGNAYVSFRHPVPIVPNVRISHTFLENSGSGTANFGNNVIFNAKDSIIDISHTDVTLFWTPIDIAFFTWDLGASARIFDGNIRFRGTFTSAPDTPVDQSSALNPTYALLYNNFGFDLPLGLGVQVELTGGSNGKETAIDTTAKLEYESFFGLGAALGYRYLDIDLESKLNGEKLIYKLDAHGPFLSLFYRL